MTQDERLNFLLDYLRDEHPVDIPMPNSYVQKWTLFRGLINIREPHPVSEEFISVQNDFLHEVARQKGIVQFSDIPTCRYGSGIALWQGDITSLHIDTIVNAANSKLLGCFVPGHGCIDNAIHTFAGLQLRQACFELMQTQGHDEPTGTVKITPAYNLPSRYVMHTVGPIVRGALTQNQRTDLTNCYHSCLVSAAEHNLESIAFCCISTGEFHFPQEAAAEIAVQTVTEFLTHETTIKNVVFNVFKDDDYSIYQKLL
jgi:O-acetyl-ADP-ribose deacetylase (regulator of RNase III)